MNLKTTLLLALLLAAGGGAWYAVAHRETAVSASPSLEYLDNLKPDALTRIEIDRKGQTPLVLEKVGDQWTLPGKWPVRGPEVKALVETLTHLHSRFAPIAADKNTNYARYGLGDKALTVKLTAGGKTTAFLLGEETAESNRFTRSSFLKIDGKDEIIRLGPGLVAALDRPVEYYQQRRLFPVERVAKDEDATDKSDKVEQVVAEKIRIQGPDGDVTVQKHKTGWQVEAPVKDHVDPEKIKSLLTGLTDLWADRFVDDKSKSLEDMGLAKPEYTFEVKRPGGGDITLLVGKVSSSKDKIITKPGPPPQPFMPPQKPNIQIVKEEYRYAKLPDNDQIFEIKTDKLKDLVPSLGDVRDARVARFKTADVTKIEIDVKGKSIVLAKDKDDKWKIEKPLAVAAERPPVTELLDKLSGLEAKGAEIRDKEDPKAVGLEKPMAKIVLTLEEGKKDKTTRMLTYDLGESEKEKGKLFVQLAGWPRVNVLGDDLVKLVDRDVLAYRQRKLVDVAGSNLAKIQIARGSDDFTFEKKNGAWSQVAPTAVKIEETKVDLLASELARLETTEYIADAPKDPKSDELEKSYGLGKPALKVTFEGEDKKSPHRLLVGKPRTAKDDYFARLDDGPIFVLKKDLFEKLDRDSLAYRPTQAWKVVADNIVELKVKKEADAYAVTRGDKTWTINGPFTAPARSEYVDSMADELAELKSEKYVAQASKDLAKFGLDKPYLRFEVVSRVKEKAKEEKKDEKKDEKEPAKETPKDAPKEKDTVVVLEIGKLDDVTKSRYARIGDGDAIFLIGDKALSILDRGPLDLLDRVLLKLDVANISQIRYQGGSPFTLEKKKDNWEVVGSPAPPYAAEDNVVQATLRPWANLLAGKIAAYGPKIEWANFGLEKPATTIQVSTQDADKKAVEHTLALGKDAGDGKRFVRVDQRQEVAVLEADTAKDLARTHLDFVNPRVLKFAFDAVTKIDRAMKDADVELVKKDDSWQLTKPVTQAADVPTVDEILEKTFQLKAKRVAAYPAKDLKEFGLDSPAATVVLSLGDDKKHVIKIGDKTKDDERYAIVDDGKAVIVLGSELSRMLTAPALAFADRNIASFGAADRVELIRGDRKAVFAKSGADWKMIEPTKSDAEDALGDLVKSLYRLRADEIVAGKDADLKTYGLDPPTEELKIQSGDKEQLDLLIGGEEKGVEKGKEPRRYARLAKGGQVFLLGAKTSAAVLAEFRTRKPWPPLDAAQIDRVTVSGEAGNFTLVKDKSMWTVKDRPDDKVNAKTATDLLDALASLKVDRYLADTKGNLQLFGLEPPVTKIEIATAAGARTLLIGRKEGDSRRVYAAVQGSDAIFVIGDADAARILRPLSGYVESK